MAHRSRMDPRRTDHHLADPWHAGPRRTTSTDRSAAPERIGGVGTGAHARITLTPVHWHAHAKDSSPVSTSTTGTRMPSAALPASGGKVRVPAGVAAALAGDA